MGKEIFSESAAIAIIFFLLEFFPLAYFLVDNRKWDIYYINHITGKMMIKLPVSVDFKIGQQKIIIEKQKFYIIWCTDLT